MNGDILTDIDYAALLERHRQGGQIATIAAHQRDVQVSLGVMRFEQDADPTVVTDYIEKPSPVICGLDGGLLLRPTRAASTSPRASASTSPIWSCA